MGNRPGFQIKYLNNNPRLAWGWRHRRPYASAELMITDTITAQHVIDQFKREGYSGVCLS